MSGTKHTAHFETVQMAEMLRSVSEGNLATQYDDHLDERLAEATSAVADEALAEAMEDVLGIDAYDEAVHLAQRYHEQELAGHPAWQEIFGYSAEQRGGQAHDRYGLAYYMGENIGLVMNEACDRMAEKVMADESYLLE